jgi:hypothetical protein
MGAECPTFLKKQKKELSNSWTDFNDESERDVANKVWVFTDEEMAEAYRLLLTEWEKACTLTEKHKKIIKALLQEKEELTSTVTNLEEEVGKKIGDMKGIRFDYSSMNKDPPKKIVPSKKKSE